MSKDEYRKAFKDSGLKASSWCKFLCISEYQHRNYQNGRTVVPEYIAKETGYIIQLFNIDGV